MGAGASLHPAVTNPKKRGEGRNRPSVPPLISLYTDIHSHVIWGVDDGAETKEETFRMLESAVKDGIGRIICTPHITPGVYEFPEEAFQSHFRQAQEYIAQKGLPLTLLQGAELLYTDSTPRLLREGKAPTLAGTDCALIEFSPTDTAAHITDALQKVASAGVIPVIAHMERYPAIHKIEQVKELKSRYRARVQINARSLTRKQPLLYRGFFDKLFREGLVDYVATDTHAMPGRETCMTEGMRALAEKYGENVASHILYQTEHFFA